MNVDLKLFMDFRRYLPPDSVEGKAMVSLQEGATVDDLFKTLGIPINQPKVLVINGVSQGMDQDRNSHVLKDGDVVSVFPPVGGG
jgi:molybdopterin converting factor small subunit